jgi:uncharacterized protein
MAEDTMKKYSLLLEQLKKADALAVAFSGGVDSTLLLKAAKEALGDRVLAVTAICESTTASELTFAKQFCVSKNIAHQTLTVEQMKIDGFASNPRDRCYLCKKGIFGAIIDLAKNRGISIIAEGTNADDVFDYRPGAKAICELGVTSPLKQAGLTKNEIREISRALVLPTWDKPSTPCLATRIPTGEQITIAKLRMIEESEQFLSGMGFRQMRVRIHGDDLARIEVMPNEFDELVKNRKAICEHLKKAGFRYVSMDLSGYLMGNMNKTD